jgi:hypothetical protein
MKKTYTITYTNSLFQVVKQLTVKGSIEQARRFATGYGYNHGLMFTNAIIKEVA